MKDQYIACGVNMLPLSARHNDETGGGQKREAVTSEILGRMRSGRFKVFSNLSEWFEEKRMLHRVTKNGQSKIVDRNDDMECATRYACMMLRYAVSDVEADESRYRGTSDVDRDYDPLTEYSHSGII